MMMEMKMNSFIAESRMDGSWSSHMESPQDSTITDQSKFKSLIWIVVGTPVFIPASFPRAEVQNELSAPRWMSYQNMQKVNAAAEEKLRRKPFLHCFN